MTFTLVIAYMAVAGIVKITHEEYSKDYSRRETDPRCR